jgi:transcription antitermination factor NusG
MDKVQHTNALWYAIRVRTGHEQRVSATLSDKGYEEFLPVYRSTRKWSDRSKQLNVALFPGYLFCRLDVQHGLLPIVTTPGIISVVGAGRLPVAIPDHEIEALRTVVRSGLHAQPWPNLAVGAKVLIESGPLAGLEGVTLQVDKKFRLMLSVSLLQRSVAVEIDRGWVRPLRAAAA